MILAPALRAWNPTRAQWIGGAVASGVLVGVVWVLLRDDTPSAPTPSTVPGGEGAGGPFPMPPDDGYEEPGLDPKVPDDQFEPPDDPDPGVPPEDPGGFDPGLPGWDPPIDEDYEPPQGGIDLPPGGGQPPDLGPVIGPIMPGVFTPPASPPAELIYTPAPEHLSLIATPWNKRYTQHIVLFDFAQGQHQLLRDWTLRFGLCLTTNSTFGALTDFINGATQPDQGDFADPMLRFGLRNVDAIPIQLDGFASPLTYKRRYAVKFRRGNPVVITQATHEINDWATLDACVGRVQRWPTPTSNLFWVKRVGGVQYEQWDPKPQVSVIAQGAKIMLRISYVGMPWFEVTTGESNAANPNTEFKLDLKINARGTNT